MFDNVVVGIDNYEAGRDALELAKQLVAPDGDILLVFVEVVRRAPGPDTDPQWQLDERRRALERLASVRDDANADAQLLTVQAGSPARGLHEAVRRHGDLLVIGASRRDEFERTFVGDDPRQVLQDAPSAVGVAPPGYATRLPSLDTIGVGYDGSPASEQALTVASALARERGAELSALDAVAEPMYASDPVSGQWALEGRLEKAQKQLAELGGVKPHVAWGDAAQALARYAASIDLLVIGSHEYRLRDRFSGGSTTSQRLADSAACPLLVLGPGTRDAARAR
jgi:nucleotide-binding universal stress UspA family protein